MAQVPIQRTVTSTKGYASAVIIAWRELWGATPTKAQAGVIYAQWIVETSGRDCWNNNIGNVKVTPGQVAAGVDWIDLPGTWENINGKRVVLPDGDPGRRFRAYASFADGMSEHLTFLRKHWGPAWAHVEGGNPDGFAHALKAGRDGREGTWDDYFTAPANDYARIMVGAHKGWMSSDAFDSALLGLSEVAPDTIPAEAETQPYPVEPQPIVHTLNLPGLPGFEPPPDDAA